MSKPQITKITYEQSRIIRPYESAKISAECIIGEGEDPKEALRILKEAVINNLCFPAKEREEMLLAMGAKKITAKEAGAPEVELGKKDGPKDEPVF